MIATWKRQAIEGMAATFSGAGEAAKAAGEADLEKLHKIGQLVVERDFCRRRSRDERRAAATDDRAGACQPVDCGAVPAGVDQPVVLLLCPCVGDGRDAGADGGDRRLVP
jgi:transposase